MRTTPIVAALVLLGALPVMASAQTAPSSQTTLTIPRATRTPTLHDLVGDRLPAEWKIEGFRQREPGDGTPIGRATTAYLVYDDRTLYIGFRCAEEADHIRGRLAKRENIDDDDHVAVFIDTFHDHQRAYVFAVNPAGVQLDAIQPEGDDLDTAFDAVWSAETASTPDGFAVLIAIPFQSLRFPQADSQTWGLALGRVRKAASEKAFWPYITQRIEGFTNQMAVVSLQGVSPGRNLRFTPYAALAAARFLDTSIPARVRSDDARVGLDAKVVARDALTFDFTANPDFSTVESDEPQVTINQRFEVIFPERRPFFTENADFFSSPDQLFFSRRIIDPRAGARVTGKVGRWSVGGLILDDRQAGADDESAEPESGRAGVGVMRVQRDVGEQSKIGVLTTMLNGPFGVNNVISGDVRWKLSPTWVFNGLAAWSETTPKASPRHSGTDFYAELERQGRTFAYSGFYLDRGAGFDPRLGYVERVDIRQTEHDFGLTWHPEKHGIVSIGPYGVVWADWDHQGVRQDWSAQAGLSGTVDGPIDFGISRTENEEVFLGLPFRQHTTEVSVTAARWQTLTLAGALTGGRGVNYDPPAGQLPSLGHTLSYSAGATWRPVERVRVDEIYYYTRLRTLTDQPVFVNHLARVKVNYQFTHRLSARAILDYGAVRPDNLYASQPRASSFTADALVTYFVDPFTAVYAGYTDRYEDQAIDRFGRLQMLRSPTGSTARQLFVKVVYGIRF